MALGAAGRVGGKIGSKLVRNIAEEVGETVTSKIKKYKPTAGAVSTGKVKKFTPGREPGWDWGWKGGKPGELTGSDYVKEMYKAYPLYSISGTYPREFNKIINTAQDQLQNGTSWWKPYMGSDAIMESFYNLEKANVPREWTGKILNAVNGDASEYGLFFNNLQEVSDLMKPMSNKDREIFLSLIASRRLRNREELLRVLNLPEKEKEAFMSYLIDWDGTLDELFNIAKVV